MKVKRGLFTSKKEKAPVMDTPKSIKTKENPKMKKIEERKMGVFSLIAKTLVFIINEK